VLHPISVIPTQAGWMVQSEQLAAPLVFRSGAMAEDAAWRIARALTDKGAWAEIKVTSPDYVRLSRFLCPPPSVSDGSCTLPEFATAA